MSRPSKRSKIDPQTSKHSLMSGQFMKSSIDNDSEPIDVPCPSPIPNANEPLISHPLPIVNDHNERRTVPNNVSGSIYSLLRVINAAYRSNLTSPKWKNFSGSRIQCQDKIRLNNAIWRIWHQQYIKNKKIVACRFVSLTNVQMLPTQLTQQARQQILQNLTGEYLKWRQNSKITLRKSLVTSSLTTNRTSSSPMLIRRNATPPPDPYSLFDGLDLLEHQLLFSTTNSLHDREFENPFSVQGNNPDLYQPIMGNCHFDFNPSDESFFTNLTNDDFLARFTGDSVSTLSLPPNPTSYLPPPPPPPVQSNPNPTPINILPSNIYNPINYSTDQFNNYPSETTTVVYPQSSNHKSNSSTLVNLLKSSPTKPSKRSARKSSIPPVQLQNLPNPNQTMLNLNSTQKMKRQRSSISENFSSTMNNNNNSKHHENSFVSTKPIESIDTSPSSTSSCGQNADSKRRQNIKNGFDNLRQIIPELNDSSNAKISKAHMLEFTARHIEDAIEERDRMKADLNRLELERNQLHEKVNQYQTRLPNDGLPTIPIVRQSREASNALFRRYVVDRTRKNWLFYPYSLILRSLFEQYQNTIKNDSFEEFLRSLNEWKNKSLNLVHLRQAALQTVMEMGSKTSLVTAPERVPDECRHLSTSDHSVHMNQ